MQNLFRWLWAKLFGSKKMYAAPPGAGVIQEKPLPPSTAAESRILAEYEKRKYLPHHYQADGFSGPIFIGKANQRKRRKLARQTGRRLATI